MDNPENAKLKDLNLREVMTLLPIVACCVWIGLYPKPFFDILDKPVTELVQKIEAPATGVSVASVPAAPEPPAR
jgi:NADH-quinone oxidoreductase subunit M